jgi:Fe-S cluster biogenesis protein NfuA
MATADEFRVANLGYPFPWGRSKDARNASGAWRELGMGIGGLFHHKWFRTSGGRFGGAKENVTDVFPGSLRYNLRFGGGDCPEIGLEENEGIAAVKEFGAICRDENVRLYHKVQIHALSQVVADGGEIIVSPFGDEVVYVGFAGRCMFCPNAQSISFQELCTRVLDYKFELFPEWQNWRA